MTTVLASPPDKLAVRAALDSGAFQSGVDNGRWRLVEFEWPFVVFAISAATRPNSPKEFGLRIDLSGYPRQAPTAEPWSIDRSGRLIASERPKGERANEVFRCDWEQGRALYAPWDRIGLESHSEWASQHPAYAWHPGRDLTFFLRCVHDILNDYDYLGI
ncbi:MAG: hypothetical protein OXG11_01560 [Chloroflexi bacterium]|nr:hypothetical protein [Chloroflexota bacterium]